MDGAAPPPPAGRKGGDVQPGLSSLGKEGRPGFLGVAVVSCLVPYVSAVTKAGGIGEGRGAAENRAGMTGSAGVAVADSMRADGDAVGDDGGGEGAENKPL